MRRFEGRVAVVTGAASGIGHATSALLARRGCDLALVDIDESGLAARAARVRATGRQVSLHRVDGAIVDVGAVEGDLALDAAGLDDVVHPVETAQEGRLAAARGSDQRGHLAFEDVDVDAVKRLVLAIEDIEPARRHFYLARHLSRHPAPRVLPDVPALLGRYSHAPSQWCCSRASGSSGSLASRLSYQNRACLPTFLVTTSSRSACANKSRSRSSRSGRRAGR